MQGVLRELCITLENTLFIIASSEIDVLRGFLDYEDPSPLAGGFAFQGGGMTKSFKLVLRLKYQYWVWTKVNEPAPRPNPATGNINVEFFD